jgi:Fur family transcriptional regulator, zinc uptake regulator
MAKTSRSSAAPAAAPAAAAVKRPSAAREKAAALEQRLSEAQRLCTERGGLLTPLRREVLRLLLKRGGSAKAYDLHDDMRGLHGRVAPMTVYRALDFLMQMRLVHKVDSLNSFVVCNEGEAPGAHPHQTLMSVCTACNAVTELHLHDVTEPIVRHLQDKLGFRTQAVEVKGLCKQCTGASRPA